MSDSDKGPGLLIKQVDGMKVGGRVNQLEDSEDLTTSLVGQAGALVTPHRRNLAVTPSGRYTVGGDRGHSGYFNRKYKNAEVSQGEGLLQTQPCRVEGTRGTGGDDEKLEAGRRSPGRWDSDLR